VTIAAVPFATLSGVELWQIPLDLDEAALAVLARDLSTEERTRAGRLALPQVRTRFVAARAGLRRLLARHVGGAPAALDLRVGERGKPFLPGGPSFNLSHSGDLAVCAVAGMREVGVDVEELRLVPEAFAIAERHLGAEVCRELGEAGAERDRTFLRHWTRREAFLKALGIGLADEPSPAMDPQRWEVHELIPGASYVGALVVARS
jgi:4'-phosphopantetheinyl transferase